LKKLTLAASLIFLCLISQAFAQDKDKGCSQQQATLTIKFEGCGANACCPKQAQTQHQTSRQQPTAAQRRAAKELADAREQLRINGIVRGALEAQREEDNRNSLNALISAQATALTIMGQAADNNAKANFKNAEAEDKLGDAARIYAEGTSYAMKKDADSEWDRVHGFNKPKKCEKGMKCVPGDLETNNKNANSKRIGAIVGGAAVAVSPCNAHLSSTRINETQTLSATGGSSSATGGSSNAASNSSSNSSSSSSSKSDSSSNSSSKSDSNATNTTNNYKDPNKDQKSHDRDRHDYDKKKDNYSHGDDSHDH